MTTQASHTKEHHGPGQRAWRSFLQSKGAMAALVFLAVMLVGSLLLPLLWPHHYATADLPGKFQSPSVEHPFGTDALGRDLFARMMYGAKISFSVGICATTVSLVIGVAYGLIAGWFGGRVDNFMMRAVDALASIPFMFLVLMLMTLSRDFIMLFVALGAVQWLTMARIVRGQTLSLKQREFVLAARTMGSSTFFILTRHILPNVMGPVIVCATLMVPAVMLEEAFLSFLGLGIEPPKCSWGTLADDARKVINPVQTYWWLVVFPAAALAVTLLGLNLIGDALRDALDPQQKHRGL